MILIQFFFSPPDSLWIAFFSSSYLSENYWRERERERKKTKVKRWVDRDIFLLIFFGSFFSKNLPHLNTHTLTSYHSLFAKGGDVCALLMCVYIIFIEILLNHNDFQRRTRERERERRQSAMRTFRFDSARTKDALFTLYALCCYFAAQHIQVKWVNKNKILPSW